MAICRHFGNFQRLLATTFLPKNCQKFGDFFGNLRIAKILISDHIKQSIFTLDVYILGFKIAFDIDIWSL